MKKQQFIQELTTALVTVDAQTRSEIIADINEHFVEGTGQGQSEEEICKNLGQPSQIAEQVLEEYKAFKSRESTTDFDNHDYNHFDESLESILKSAAKITRTASDKLSRLRGGIVADISEAMSDINDEWHETGNNANYSTEGATRIPGGYEINIDKTLTDISSMDINLELCNLQIIPASQYEDVRVTIKGKSRYNTFIVENKNGCLIINQSQPKFRFEIFKFNSNLEAIVYVPASFAGDIRVVSHVGNIYITGVGCNLMLKAHVGNIDVNGHTGDIAHLRSAAGNINLVDCDIRQIDAKASAGNVNVNCKETHSLNLSSSAGEVWARADKLYGDTSLSSSAGNVSLEAHDVQGNITAKSSAGNVNIYLPKDINCRIDVKKSFITTVNNHLTGNPQSPYVLRVATGVGSVTLSALQNH